MLLIAGLGNPTKEYEHTRHNMGFDCVDVIAGKFGIKINKSRFKALFGVGTVAGEKVVLIKPQTFMNLSGYAVGLLVKFYKADPKKDLLVIYDDTDIEAGHIRIRKSGSAGGHNGMKSIISSLGTEEFARIRIGIGKRKENDEMVDFVLGRFSAEDRKIIDEAIGKAADAACDMAENGIDHAMNRYNG